MNSVLNILLIVLAIHLLIVGFILAFRYFRLQKGKNSCDTLSITLLNQFRSMAPNFENLEELQDYLEMISEYVKLYENDRDFLIQYNDIIKEIRKRILK